jgi:hypothetical protein
MRVPRSTRLAFASLLVAAATLVTPAGGTAKNAQSGIAVSLDRAGVTTRLGKSFDFSSTITNSGGTRLDGLVAHLNVVSLTRDVYVDPEDWSDERTRFLAPLDPGRSAKTGWNVKAVNSGRFAVYVVVVPIRATEARPLAVSPALAAHVAERRTLNSDGVLPLALGVPALIGIAMLGVRRRRRVRS